jgi:hypothetical protein
MTKKKAATKTRKKKWPKPPARKPPKVLQPGEKTMRTPPRKLDTTGIVVGQRFGKLLVTEISWGSRAAKSMASCLCDCGNTHDTRLYRLIRGSAIECTSCVQTTRWSLRNQERHIDHFKKLGSKGGKQTLKNNGPLYFRRIAMLAHQKRRENAAARELEKDAAAAR